MSSGSKTVHDPVHGGIAVDGPFLKILDRHEMQRLRGVKQLGAGNMVFPGANHTRFEHCLGTYRLAGRMAEAISLSKEDSDAVRAAALMHDICHAPFSHTLESTMEDRTGLDHMELARRLILGEIPTYRPEDEDIFGGTEPISAILEDAGIDPVEVCELISSPRTTEREEALLDVSGAPADHFPSKDYIHQIIHGPVDADQMDYLARDAHYTGVAMGNIDIERLISTMAVMNDRICIRRGGAPAAEGLMVSRSLMYTTIYFHQTVRVIERMIAKAAEESEQDLDDIYLLDDADLGRRLIDEGGVPSKLMRLVRARRFFRRAVTVMPNEADEDLSMLLAKYSARGMRPKLEKAIADRAGVEQWEVAVDMPSASTLLSKVQIGKTDVSILDADGRIRPLTRSSPLAKALQSRDAFGWSVVVACPVEKREAVSRAASRVLGLRGPGEPPQQVLASGRSALGQHEDVGTLRPLREAVGLRRVGDDLRNRPFAVLLGEKPRLLAAGHTGMHLEPPAEQLEVHHVLQKPDLRYATVSEERDHPGIGDEAPRDAVDLPSGRVDDPRLVQEERAREPPHGIRAAVGAVPLVADEHLPCDAHRRRVLPRVLRQVKGHVPGETGFDGRDDLLCRGGDRVEGGGRQRRPVPVG